jgi:hypothetical protein
MGVSNSQEFPTVVVSQIFCCKNDFLFSPKQVKCELKMIQVILHWDLHLYMITSKETDESEIAYLKPKAF